MNAQQTPGPVIQPVLIHVEQVPKLYTTLTLPSPDRVDPTRDRWVQEAVQSNKGGLIAVDLLEAVRLDLLAMFTGERVDFWGIFQDLPRMLYTVEPREMIGFAELAVQVGYRGDLMAAIAQEVASALYYGPCFSVKEVHLWK
jgi:hypothetical protein